MKMLVGMATGDGRLVYVLLLVCTLYLPVTQGSSVPCWLASCLHFVCLPLFNFKYLHCLSVCVQVASVGWCGALGGAAKGWTRWACLASNAVSHTMCTPRGPTMTLTFFLPRSSSTGRPWRAAQTSVSLATVSTHIYNLLLVIQRAGQLWIWICVNLTNK